MDTAVLTLRGRGDRGEGETDVSRQKPHASAARYFPWRTVKVKRKENNIVGPVQSAEGGEGRE